MPGEAEDGHLTSMPSSPGPQEAGCLLHVTGEPTSDRPSHLCELQVLTSSKRPLPGDGGVPSTTTVGSKGSSAFQDWLDPVAEFAHGSLAPGTECAHCPSAL